MPYTLQPLTPFHRYPIIDIFNHYILNSFAAFFEKPLPYPFFDRLLEMKQDYPAFIARSDSGEVIGFGLLRPYHPASSFRRTAEISYFVRPEHTRRGIGALLLERLMAEARDFEIDTLVARVCSRNEQGLAFHRKHGFVECGRLAGIGRKGGEEFDVVWMQRRI